MSREKGEPFIVTAAIIAAWYGSNIGVLLLNKYLLSIYGFKYPVFLTLCHMVACSATSYAVAASRLVPLAPVKSRQQFAKIAVLAVVFCLTVVLGNVSLRFIPVSFNQAIGATTPAFTAGMSVLLLRQRESRGTYLSLVPVILGIVIASGAEPLFNLIGFLAAISATGARAFKSVLQGMMLSDPAERMDSMSLLTYMAPVAVLTLIPTTLIFESGSLAVAMQLGKDGKFWGLLALNSFMAYFVNLTNFLVTKHTSALTLQVLGNAKGVVAVVVSVLYFRNPVNFYSVFGYAITVGGVVAYSQAKKRAKRDALTKELKQGDAEMGFVDNVAVTGAGYSKQQQQQPDARQGFFQRLGLRRGAAGSSVSSSDPVTKLERGGLKPGSPTSTSPTIPAGGATGMSDKLGGGATMRILADARNLASNLASLA